MTTLEELKAEWEKVRESYMLILGEKPRMSERLEEWDFWLQARARVYKRAVEVIRRVLAELEESSERPEVLRLEEWGDLIGLDRALYIHEWHERKLSEREYRELFGK